MSSVLSYYTKFIRSLNLGHNIILDIVCNRCGETGLSVVVKDLDDPIAFEVIKKKMNGFLESHMGHGGYFLQSGKGKWKIPEVGFDEGKDDRPDLQETSKVGSLERTQEDLKKTKWESDPNIKEKRDKKNHTSVFKRKNGKNCDGCTVANHSFPNEIISGVAGEFADLYSQYIESPRIFLFFGFLVCLGSILAKKLKLLSERIFSPRYYILFLGESASDRKSTAIDTPVNFFAEFFPHTLNVCYLSLIHI